MLGIIAYGSLIHPEETAKYGAHPTQMCPVKLATFRRLFNQRPAWRRSGLHGSAVLNVEQSELAWLNAVCYCFSDFDFTGLDDRERGYERTTVAAEKISCYPGYQLPKLENIAIYLGRQGHQSSTITPNPDYLEICLAGAQSWGKTFYRDFLTSTHVNNGLSLKDFLESLSRQDR